MIESDSRVLAVLLIGFALYVVIMPVTYAEAATLNISPNNGTKGTIVTITGSGFNANTLLTITNIAGSTTSVTSDSGGNIPINTTITMEPTTWGERYVRVSDGVNMLTATFSMKPSLELVTGYKADGQRFDNPLFIGYGFTSDPNFLPSLTYNGNRYYPVDNSLVDSTGTIKYIKVQFSNAVAGPFNTTVTDVANHTATFPLRAFLATLNGSNQQFQTDVRGHYGDPLQVVGAGFIPGDAITFFLSGIQLIANPSVVVANDGTFTGNILTGEADSGDLTVFYRTLSVVDQHGHTFGYSFQILPSIALTPSQGISGSTISIKGHGFDFGQAISPVIPGTQGVSFDGVDMITNPPNVAISSIGNWTAQITVPNGENAGNHLISAFDGFGTGAATLTVLPTISGTPTTTSTIDTSGNTIITGANASAATVVQFTLPPGTTISNNATAIYNTIGGNTVAQTSGLTVPYPPGKSIKIASNPGLTQVCIIDSPTAASLQNVLCGADLSQSMSVLNCSTTGISTTISGFPSAPTSRTYTCTISNVGGQTFLQVDGLAFSKIIIDGPYTITSIVAPLNPVQVGTSITANATFADPGLRETHTAVWDWGDGTSAGTVNENAGSVVNTHTYTTPGVYTIQLTVNDNDGASVTSSFQYVVVYDPNGGFVTGGGSTNSTAGAYVVNPTFTGKAHFGYQVKYKPGTTIPTGDMNLNLKDGKLMKSEKDDEKDPFKSKLKATSFNWLVITGATAQFQGTGIINGTGNYGFTVTMFDGAIGGGTDKLGIKIIDNNHGGAVIYDTQQGTAHTTTVPLTKGNVKIHAS